MRTADDIVEEAQRRALERIKEGELLREFDLRMILRQVIKEEREKAKKENQADS